MYQGKEYVEAFGYNSYDFHARGYNAFTGRFDGVDAVDHYGISGYAGMANNPVSAIDPDGNNPLIAAAVGGIIGAVSYTLNAAFSSGGLKANWRLGGFATSVGIGAFSGAFSFGIGEAAAGMSGVGKFAFQTGMHGYVGGFSSVMQGGSFTGAAGSVVGTATANMNSSLQIGASALFSGGVAELSGGNFWQGAAQGAIIAGLNHGLHRFERTAWDLNNDGILQKNEADKWWLKGKGKPIGVDNNKIDWSGLEIPNNVEDGDNFAINTTEAFKKLSYETAATYGGTSFKLISRKYTLARVLDQDYHYNMRNWKSTENVGRNILTQMGQPIGSGRTFNIHYYNPRFRISSK
ncbi:MAG: hypothetical protein EAZ22_17130 [Cytophagales bacterium]|nr:MAG: hypothetical protein EAZ38_16595 [Cytophagales bacterium]TAG76784.1 MAG: hypothetical protein EAZ22_17130 [Cytophagales bacterium]